MDVSVFQIPKSSACRVISSKVILNHSVYCSGWFLMSSFKSLRLMYSLKETTNIKHVVNSNVALVNKNYSEQSPIGATEKHRDASH